MEYIDHYAVLGITRDANAAGVRTAFRMLAKRCHPDLNNGSPDSYRMFRLITNACEVLSDPASRARYDNFLARCRCRKANDPAVGEKERNTRLADPRQMVVDYLNMALWEIADHVKDCSVVGRRRAILVILTFLDRWILTPCGFPDYFSSARGLVDRDPREYVRILSSVVPASAHVSYTGVEDYFYDIRRRTDRFLSFYERGGIREGESIGDPSFIVRVIELHNLAVHYLEIMRGVPISPDGTAADWRFSDEAFAYPYPD